MVHFKNDSVKGEQHLPLTPSLLEKFVYLEQAIASKMHNSPTLFCSHSGDVYGEDYFSTICSGVLSYDGVHLTCNDLRHKFVTSWRDFVNSPTTQLYEFSVQQACAAASNLMLNSTQVWDATYDDTNRARGILIVMRLWPKFLNFLKEQHLDLESREDWNPLTTPLDELGS